MYRHVPNLITILRLLLTVLFFFILNTNDVSNFQRQMWIGFVVFVVATLTDILDGYLARKWKVESAFGRVVDPFVDKILICGAFIFFSSNHFIDAAVRTEQFPEYAAAVSARVGVLPSLTGVVPWMVVVLIAREFLITSIRGLAEAQGVDFRADWAGKVKMFTQSVAAGAVMVDLAVMGKVPWVHATRDAAIWTTVVVTI
ncbi:MAG TPA: CDP-alcohol phosphatidyltransferase family protein, partial [Phycisphaerae bacterium]|nr:CDP-alcohol phosphatidyltransferase family protein [Phycisphaerae bacterium]